MAVFLFEIIAILIFVRLADKSRLRQLAPLLVAGIFIRFMQHLVIIDWLHFMQIAAPKALRLWIPISAELTVWLTASYLFIQYMPKKLHVLYGLLWVGVMGLYMQALRLLNVITFHKGWSIAHCVLLIGLFFLGLWLLWRWLRPHSSEPYQQAAWN